MIPADYQVPAAAFMLIGGLVSCFLGYRLFRTVLTIFGFIFGALMASSLFGASDTGPMLAAALAGGIVGGLILFLAYFVGVSLVGAGLGAAVANIAFSVGDADPNVLVVIALAVIGAALAMYLQRYFLIVGTAFVGAWTAIVGAVALMGDRSALAEALSRDVWVVYPLTPAPGQSWVPIAWIVLSAIGTAVQLGYTGGDRGRVYRGRRKRPAPAT